MADLATAGQALPKYDLLSPAFFVDPHSVFHAMRKEDPVYWHPILNVWVLTRYDDIQAMLRDPRFSAERMAQFEVGVSDAMKPKLGAVMRFLSHWMVMRDPPRHTLLRTLLGKAFTPQVIEGLRPVIQELVDEMCDIVIDSGEMDVIADIAFPLPAIVIGKMLGVPRDDIDAFKAWTSELFMVLGGGTATDAVVESGYRGMMGLDGYFRKLIADRRKAPTDDLLSRLIAVEEQGEVLNEEELVSTCAMLLVAGHETTTHLIGNAVLALLQNPSELQKLRDDPSLIPNAIEEFLRYDGAAFMLSRRATEDVEIGGKKIAANQIVFGFAHAANRDPAVFPEPDRLDVTRANVKGVGFGHGIHYCIGAALARMEAQIAIGAIVTRLPGLAHAAEVVDRVPSIAVHGLGSLPVTFQTASPASIDARHSWTGPMSIQSPLSVRAPVSIPFRSGR